MRITTNTIRTIFLALTLAFLQPVTALTAELPEVTKTGSRVTEKNDTFWRFAWQLSFYNPNNETFVFDVEIHWIDSDGFVINTDR